MMSHNLDTTPYISERFPLVSVIVPVFNAEKFLRETLESILCQTYRPTEIITVDDGSTDSSPDILREYADRIHCIHQENQGVGVARNVGVEHSVGSYVAFCDADDIWFPEKLKSQMEIVNRHPCIGVVGGFMEDIDELGRPLKSCHRPLKLHDKPMKLQQAFLMEGNMICLSTALIRKDVFSSIGGFQAGRHDIKAEDFDLWIRLSRNTQFYLSSKCMGQYRILKKSRSHGSLRKEYGAQFQLLRMYRSEYTPENYNVRKAKIYSEWAESSFVEGESHAWKLQVKAMKLHPANLYHQVRFGRGLVKNLVKRLLRLFQGNTGFRKDIG